MVTVNIHKAKTHLSALLALMEQGEQVIIARNGAPVARLEPYKPPHKPSGKRQPGAWKGLVTVGPEFFEPLPEEEPPRG